MNEDDYLNQLVSILGARRQEPLAPAISQIQVAPPPSLGGGVSGGGEAPQQSEESAIVSGLGSAIGGIAHSYGMANQTGAYAPGGALGGAGGGLGGGTAMALKSQGIAPRGPSTTAYDPSQQRTVQQPPGYGTVPNSTVDSALAKRGFGKTDWGVTPTSPTGVSAIQDPRIEQIARMSIYPQVGAY